MSKILLLSVALLALSASIASAQSSSSYGGIKLAWNDCLGSGGVTNRTFACDTNVGINDLYVSFDPPQDIPDVNGLNVIIDLNDASSPLLPAWWRLKNAGSCRMTALSAGTITGSCPRIWSGLPNSSIAAYFDNTVAPIPPNMARILGSVSVPSSDAAPVHPGTEYTAQVIHINNTRTTGLGACAGCQDQVCLEVIEVLLSTNQSGDFTLLNPGHCGAPPPPGWSYCSCPGAPGTSVTWQGSPTPTLNRTWGQVKTLYR